MTVYLKKSTFLMIFMCVSASIGGTIDTIFYTSPLLPNGEQHYVLKPSHYESHRAEGKSFPVLYLLHCLGCAPELFFDKQSYEGLIDLIDSVDFIVAIPFDGSLRRWWLDSPDHDGPQPSTFLVKEFKPLIDSLYATYKDPGNCGLAGHSMGGYGSLHNLRMHPDIFGSAYSMKGLLDFRKYPRHYSINSVLGDYDAHPLLWDSLSIAGNHMDFANLSGRFGFYSGPGDWFFEENQEFHDSLVKAGIEHVYFTSPQNENHYPTPRNQIRKVLMFFDSTFTHQESSSRKAWESSVPPSQQKKFHTETRYSLDGRILGPPSRHKAMVPAVHVGSGHFDKRIAE